MRSDKRMDQAEGLRRLLVPNKTRMVTLLSGKTGVGRTSTTINLAAAMAQLGKEVLVLDEIQAPDNIPETLGLHARYDLLDIAQQKCSYHDAVLNTHGFSVLHAARAMNFLSQMSHTEQQRVEKALAEAISSADVLLVEAAMPVLMKSHDIRQCYQETMARVLASRENGIVRQAPAGFAYGTSMLVVMDATTSGITDSYALIKKLATESACLQFGIVVNKIADARAAKIVFDNMAKVAWHKLSVRLEFVGCIPRDERLKQASSRGRAVGETYPASISAKSFLNMAHGLLHLPLHREQAGGGVRPALPGLLGPTSQPALQHGKNVAHAVNF
ncbi:MAG: P-loop NTPase [Gallionella sp.]